MAGQSPILIKNFRAQAAVPARRIVQFGATDMAALLAASPADMSVGISTDIAAAAGEPCDVVMVGITNVEFGGVVARGAPITSDAVGRAVTAAPAAGINNRHIGFALVAAVAGDIGPANIMPGIIQG